MVEKSSFLDFFNSKNMGSAYEDAEEIRRDLAGVLVMLFQMREQAKTGVISEEFAKKDFGLMKMYFAMRKAETDKTFLGGSRIGILEKVSGQLELNGMEQFVLFAAIGSEDARLLGYTENGKPSLEGALQLAAFTAVLEGSRQERAREEKLSVFLESRNPLAARKSIYAPGEPGGVLQFFCERVHTGKLEELILYPDILAQMQNMAAANRDDWTLRLVGDRGAGKQLLASHLAGSLGRSLLVLDGKRLADCKKENLLTDWLYECVLFAAVSGDLVCLKNMDAADCRLLRDSLHGLLLVAEEEGGEEYARHGLPHMVTMELKTPSTDEKVALWKAFLERFPHDDAIDPRTLGGKYVLNAGEIREVLFAAQNHANGLRREKIESGDIIWAIGQSQSGGLGSIAKPVECVFDWDDLIVEDAVKKQLEYICAQLKYRHLVGSEWGFYEKMPYGRGLSVLFYGPPGTGKTMAAQVIARETGLDLYRVDLSEMVSKYIGETEKNISRLFERARHMNVVLFFDEADAFFSKRSEVRDSHDRNANAEVAHLLQEMENYEGLTILATNRKDDMDDAFKRRIRLMLKFSFPSAETRQELWHSLLPEKTPRRENLALDFFAANFELSGSQIKDILLMAAFMAAKDGCVLGNEQIKEALCLNFQKYGKLLTEHDFEYLI